MNSSSKVIMAATMVMVVSLVMVLSLVLVVLAELYCSLLFNRRRRGHSDTLPTTTFSAAAPTTVSLTQTISTTNNNDPSPSNIESSQNPLTTGVLQTRKSFLQSKTHLSNFLHESDLEHTASVGNLVYISNPIYSTSKQTTPFETPQSSPSHLETGDSFPSSSGEEDNNVIEDSTPRLTPMKGLPEKACSVSLKGNAKSLETSGSESNNNNNGGSSSSSDSPYTSPSW